MQQLNDLRVSNGRGRSGQGGVVFNPEIEDGLLGSLQGADLDLEFKKQAALA